MTISIGRMLATLALAVLTSACSLPRGAGLQSEVLAASEDNNSAFALYPVTRAFLPSVAQWPQVNQDRLGWVTASQGSSSQVIRSGDFLTVTIWDSDPNSLIVAVDGRQTVLSDIRVSPSGSIFLPYVGNVNVGGATPERARLIVQNEMGVVSDSVQVQLSMSEGRGNSVDLVGGVNAAGSYPMPDRNYSVLSLIAAGGGVSNGLNNPQIRLQRGSKIYGTSINRLFAEPNLDTLLHGGDQVIVKDDDRYFLSVGAAGSEALHPFTKDVVSAMDAVSIVGGINDQRADPKGILILREYPRSALAAGIRGPRQQQVVFTMDLTAADGLFSARNFQVMPKDLIYVTESPLTTTQTVFGIIGSAFGLARQTGL